MTKQLISLVISAQKKTVGFQDALVDSQAAECHDAENMCGKHISFTLSCPSTMFHSFFFHTSLVSRNLFIYIRY